MIIINGEKGDKGDPGEKGNSAYEVATTTQDGLMSKEDKEKIDKLNTTIVTEVGTDLDNYEEEGTYYFDVQRTPTNVPAGSNGFLKVIHANVFIKQLWFRAGTMNTNDHETYVRTKNTVNGIWSNWCRYLTTKDNIVGGVSGDTSPIGAIMKWPSDTIPNNWLLCNGQAVSRTDYAELFAVLGTTYGAGNGSTTFNLPDFKGRATVGKDENDTDFDTLGKTGGSKHLQEHVHILEGSAGNIYYQEGGSSAWINRAADTSSEYRAYAGTMQDKNGNNLEVGHSGNLQPYTVTNYIIKAHQSAGVVAEVIQKDGQASTTNVYSADAVNSIVKDIFSTEEVKTNEKWIDGKPIYRKVIEFTVAEANKAYIVNHGILNIEQIWLDVGNSFYDFNETTKFPLTFASGDNKFTCFVGSTSINITTSAWAGKKAYIVLKYTKTTD